MFLGFDGLMQSVAIASSEHHTTGKFIDDDYLTVSYDVIHVPLHHVTRFQCLQHVMVDFHVFRIGKVLYVEVSFTLGYSVFRQRDLFVLFFYSKVIILFQRPNEAIRLGVHIRGLVTFTGNDQRRSGFIDEDGVHFVDDGVVQFPLHHIFLVDHHVVSQVIKSIFVVGSISDVCVVRRTPLFLGDAVDHTAYCKP